MSSVKGSMRTYEQRFEEATTSSQKLALSVQRELHTLRCNDSVNDNLREQVTEHREIKATLREQLYAEQRARDRAASEVKRLLIQDEDQKRKLAALEIEVARSQRETKEVPSILLRVHDLESANKAIQHEKEEAERKAHQISKQVQQKTEDMKDLQNRITELEKKLEESKNIEEVLRTERSIYEKEADAQRAAEKQDILEAARRKAERLKNQAEDEKQQLSLKLEEAKKEVQEVTSKQQEAIRATGVFNDLEKSRKCVEVLEKGMEKRVSCTGFQKLAF